MQTELQTNKTVPVLFPANRLKSLAHSERFELPTLGIEIRSFFSKIIDLSANWHHFEVLNLLSNITHCKPSTNDIVVYQPLSIRRPRSYFRVMELTRARERANTAQLVLDLVAIIYRSGRMRSPPGSNLGGEIESILLACVVLTGHVNGKPKSASDVARLLNIPRVTARRKLQELVGRGILRRAGTRYKVVEPQDRSELDYVDGVRQAVERFAQKAVQNGHSHIAANGTSVKRFQRGESKPRS